MKYNFLILILLLCLSNSSYSQRIPQVPDSIRKNYKDAQVAAKKTIDYSGLNQDSIIKVKLIKLALANPSMDIAEANQRIAEAELAKAKGSWLSSFNAGANVNEFVTRVKRDKKVAKENIVIGNEMLKQREQFLKAQVLIAYETYKEKKEMVFLQKSSIEYDFSAYEAAQSNYTTGDISMEDMNKAHQMYLNERSKLVLKEKELNVAIIELEQWVGVPLSQALSLQ